MKQTGSATYPAGGPTDHLDWKIPLGLAIGIHLAILIMALLSPYLTERRPMPEIHTVNLFSAVEMAPAVPAARPQPSTPPQPVRTMESERVKKEAAPSPPPPPPPPQAAKEPPVSERPLPSRTASDDARQRELRRQAAAEEARKAEEAARRAAERAMAAFRENLYREESAPQATQPAEAPQPAPAAPPAPRSAAAGDPGRTAAASGGEGVIVEGILRQYLAALHSRIQQHWTLPDLQKWDDNLEAVFVLKVRRDGIVTDSFFERRSGNYHFDQFVEKAIRDASPLPPFPPALREERMEIGLRFRPGGLSY